LKVGVWTVNDERSMRAFSRLGVDAIVTDRPDRLAALG
jgi:glycerophosphoryl diester phosphodiesterase